VRSDHSVLKAILLRVRYVAASSLAGISAAQATKARMIEPDRGTGCLPAMTRKRGNPNWGRPILPTPVLPTQFELRVSQLQLTAEMYTSSAELHIWCEQNRNRLYIPEWLLKEWGITVDLNFGAAA